MENNKMIEIEETEEVVEVAQESSAKKFFDKAYAGFKKHGKKIAGAAIIGAVGLAGYVLGKKSSGSDDYYDDGDDVVTVEIEDNSVEDAQ